MVVRVAGTITSAGEVDQEMLKFRQAAPALLVFFVSIVLMQLQPSLGVWSGALLVPLIVGGSLFVLRWWSATPPELALIAAAFSTIPALEHAWVFNVEGEMILAWTALFALVPALLTVAIARRSPLVRQLRTRHEWFAVVAVVCAFSYGLGAAYFANTFFDDGPVQRFDATVKSRWVHSQFGILFKRYDLNVSPWGNHRTIDSISVEPDVLMALRVGDHVRIEQLPGLLGIPWVRVTAR